MMALPRPAACKPSRLIIGRRDASQRRDPVSIQGSAALNTQLMGENSTVFPEGHFERPRVEGNSLAGRLGGLMV